MDGIGAYNQHQSVNAWNKGIAATNLGRDPPASIRPDHDIRVQVPLLSADGGAIVRQDITVPVPVPVTLREGDTVEAVARVRGRSRYRHSLAFPRLQELERRARGPVRRSHRLRLECELPVAAQMLHRPWDRDGEGDGAWQRASCPAFPRSRRDRNYPLTPVPDTRDMPRGRRVSPVVSHAAIPKFATETKPTD